MPPKKPTSKFILKSKTVNGLLITFLAPVLARYGFNESEIAEIAGLVIALGGLLWGVYGRYKAEGRVTL